MLTYFDVLIEYRGESGRASGFGTGAPTLSEAQDKALAAVRYYADLGYEVLPVEIAECCAHCHGTGKVPKRKPIFALKACPVCKGKHARKVVAD